MSAKNRPQFVQIEILNEIEFSICLINFAISMRNFDEILSKFRDKFEKIQNGKN
jgi:hypothetical protein